LAKARELAELADRENRAMTAEEQKAYDEIMAKGREVSDAVKAHCHDQEVCAFAKEEFGGGLDMPGSSTEAKSRRLSFKGLGAKVVTQMLGQDDETAKLKKPKKPKRPKNPTISQVQVAASSARAPGTSRRPLGDQLTGARQRQRSNVQ
jgi:hypothetical protein